MTSCEEEQNRNNNEETSYPIMQEVVGTLRSRQQQMGNIERSVGALSARIDRQETTLGKEGNSTTSPILPQEGY